MGINYTLPPDTRTVGSGAPAPDMNNVIDCLAAMGSGANVLNASFAGGADPTGAADSSAAVLAAIAAVGPGALYFPPNPATGTATYKVSQALTPLTGARYFGPSWGSVTIQNTASTPMWNMQPGSLLETVEIDHLLLSATGSAGDIFSGANMSRGYIHDCRFSQNNPSAAIWNAPGCTQLIECTFERNYEWIAGASRAIGAWLVTGTGVVINNNTWRDIRCFNSAPDNANPWYHLACTAGTTTQIRNNKWDSITCEVPSGGMFLLESATGTTISNFMAWDLAGNTWGAHLIQFKKNANAGACTSTRILDCQRTGGSGKGSFDDINLDVNCSQTRIEGYWQGAGGNAATIQLGGSAGAILIGCVVAPSGPAADTLVIGQGAFTVNTTAITVP